MAYRKVDDTSLASVADAIRAKGGTSDEFVFPDGFVSAIGSIQTGGGTESGLPSSADVTFGYVKKTETVTEKAPAGKCWYNGVLLPEIPADVLASYPYAWIRKNEGTGYYDLALTKIKGYYGITSGANNGGIVYGDNMGTTDVALYRVSIANANTAFAWEYYQTTNTWMGLDRNRVLRWSNHDIPNGSATATEIYFEGSEPLTELTETVTKLVPVERESEYAVTSANLNDIAKRTQEMAGTSNLLTPDDIIYWLERVIFVPQGRASSEFAIAPLVFEAAATAQIPDVAKATANSEFSIATIVFESIAVGELNM